jgi:hypothetical protein
MPFVPLFWLWHASKSVLQIRNPCRPSLPLQCLDTIIAPI